MRGKNEKASQPNSININVIGEGTTITGDFVSKGDLRVDGVIEGNVVTQAKFILGASGLVKGNIDALNCDITGKVDGNVRIKELLLIKSGGQVNGDIRTSKIVLENGAEFNGNCTMGSSVSIQKGNTSDNASQASA
jgi:cytoskeletal protein CcmA (bactofilin family)